MEQILNIYCRQVTHSTHKYTSSPLESWSQLFFGQWNRHMTITDCKNIHSICYGEQRWLCIELQNPWYKCHTTLVLVTPYGVTEHGQHWFSEWLVPCFMLSHYLSQCRLTGPSGTQYNEILFEISTFMKMLSKLSSAKFQPIWSGHNGSTHWGRVTHICVGKIDIIGSDNGLSPERRQTII